MEESKELQGFYKIFRAAVYVSVLLEFFAYAIDPATLDHWGGILCDIHSRIKRWMIYTDGNLVYSKAATVLLICITCIGTRNKKHLEFDAKRQVLLPIIFGLSLLVLSVWLFGRPMEPRLYTLPLNVILYMAASVAGVVLVHIALDNISKFIKEGLMKDRFNFENESFEQCEELIENRYSVNIPMRYYYKGKFRKGWVNISNCFRGTWVVGTPGSGKTMSIIEPFIRQHSAKGFAMVAYDYKFPTLATKLYYHYLKNKRLGKTPPNCKFNMINFVDVEYSRRVNPIQAKYINNLAAASETAETLLESLQKGKKEGGGGSDQFFQTSAVNFLAACIYFFVNYEKEPYDKNGNRLYAEKRQDPPPVVAALHVLLHAQRADGADVVQRLGHLAGDGGHSPAVVQLSGQHAALYTAGKHREQRQYQQQNQRQTGILRGDDRHNGKDAAGVRHHADDAGGEQRLHRVHIAGEPRGHLAGVLVHQRACRQLRQFVGHLGPQRVGHLLPKQHQQTFLRRGQHPLQRQAGKVGKHRPDRQRQARRQPINDACQQQRRQQRGDN